MKSMQTKMLTTLSVLLLVACSQEQSNGEKVSFDSTTRAVYGSQFYTDCDRRETYTGADLATFSDIVAVGTVMSVDAALSPMKSNGTNPADVSAESCEGTISAGVDAQIRLDTVSYAKANLRAGSAVTLRISAEELDDAWNTMAIYRDGVIEWTDGQPLMEGDQILFTAIILSDDLYSLSAHPFAWVSGERLVSATEEAHSYGCFEFEYADELFHGATDDSFRRIERFVSDESNRVSSTGQNLRNSRLMDAERGFYPDTARCFLNVVE